VTSTPIFSETILFPFPPQPYSEPLPAEAGERREQQQEQLALEVLSERLGDWLARLFLDTQHRRHGL